MIIAYHHSYVNLLAKGIINYRQAVFYLEIYGGISSWRFITVAFCLVILIGIASFYIGHFQSISCLHTYNIVLT